MSKLYVIGIGPGGREYMTEEAVRALERSDVVYGYTVYVNLMREWFPEKEFRTTGMRQEKERCRLALRAAAAGRTAAMICSGDAGVYGMAGLLIQMEEEYPGAEVEVVPGVTAALSGAAVLGAPLGHDFCVISLSDLLTPWELIEKRLRAAAMGDFAVCLYNPRSKKRPEHLRRAVKILLDAGKASDTVCGWVRNIGREGQEKKILTLRDLEDAEADMFTTVFIGSSRTRRYGDRIVTPRGYREI